MSSQIFDFCDDRRVAQEIPPNEPSVMSMNGWDFSAKPKVPYRREFKVNLYGIRWYLNAGGTALDITTDTKHNAGKLLEFYRTHRMWDSFLYNHEYLGQIRVRFSKPVQIEPAEKNSNGLVPETEINLIEHNPSF